MNFTTKKISIFMKTLFSKSLSVLFSILISISFYSFSQESSIKWETEKNQFNNGFLKQVQVLKADSNFSYFYTEGKEFMRRKYSIVKHDKKTGINKSLDLNFKIKEYNLSMVNYCYVDNTFHYFTCSENKKENKLYLFHQTIDLDKLEPNDDVSKIEEFDLKSGPIHSIDNIQYLNGRFLLTCFGSIKGIRLFGKELFDNKLKKEWENHSFAITEKGYNLESDFQIDKDGNVYVIQINFDKEQDLLKHMIKTEFNNSAKSKIWLVCYPKGGGEPTSVSLNLKDDKFILNQKLTLSKKGEVICAGLYSKLGNKSALGWFSFVIDPLVAKIKSANTDEFSSRLLTKVLDEKVENSDVMEIINKKDFNKDFDYRLDSIHFRKDGSFDLVVEKYKMVLESEYSQGGSKFIHHHYYDDLFVLNYAADGSINWTKKISKYSYVYDNDYLLGSYFLSYDKDENMNFIFNLSIEKKGLLNYTKETKTVLAKLEKNGNISFKELVTDSKIANTICPIFSYKQNENTLILTRYDLLNVLMPFANYKPNILTFGEIRFK